MIERALAVVAACLLGCGPARPDPCDRDPTSCSEATQDFITIPGGCGVLPDLDVAIGYGDTFEPLLPGFELPIYRGLQGGQHTFLAIRVANPQLDRYDKIKVRFVLVLTEPVPCSDSDAIPMPSELTTATQGICTRKVGERTIVLGQRRKLHVDAQGGVFEAGIVVFLFGWPMAAPMTVIAHVEDPCARNAVRAVAVLP